MGRQKAEIATFAPASTGQTGPTITEAPVQLITRGGSLHVSIPAGADERDWATLCLELPASIDGATLVTLDVSNLILVPAQVVRIARLVSVLAATGVEAEVACSRLTGRQLLRRLLPPHVPIVLPWSERAPHPDAPSLTPVRRSGIDATGPDAPAVPA